MSLRSISNLAGNQSFHCTLIVQATTYRCEICVSSFRGFLPKIDRMHKIGRVGMFTFFRFWFWTDTSKHPWEIQDFRAICLLCHDFHASKKSPTCMLLHTYTSSYPLSKLTTPVRIGNIFHLLTFTHVRIFVLPKAQQARTLKDYIGNTANFAREWQSCHVAVLWHSCE